MQPDGTFPDGVPNPYCRSVAQPRLLRRVPGGKAVYDTRAYWNTRDMVLAAGGQPVMGKTGHAFMKERMRAEDACTAAKSTAGCRMPPRTHETGA